MHQSGWTDGGVYVQSMKVVRRRESERNPLWTRLTSRWSNSNEIHSGSASQSDLGFLVVSIGLEYMNEMVAAPGKTIR